MSVNPERLAALAERFPWACAPSQTFGASAQLVLSAEREAADARAYDFDNALLAIGNRAIFKADPEPQDVHRFITIGNYIYFENECVLKRNECHLLRRVSWDAVEICDVTDDGIAVLKAVEGKKDD